MSQNRLLSGEELEQTYTTKMAAWDDSRLLWEMDNVAKRDAEGNHDWARQEVMAAWRKCLQAEATRRGLTAAE